MARLPDAGAQLGGEHPLTTPRGRAARLLLRLHRWAESGWAEGGVAAWGALQGSVVPGPSDALFLPFGLADPPRVWRFALAAALGSILGGLVAWAIGAYAYDSVGEPLLRLLGMDAGELARARRLFERHGWLFVLASTVSPLSTKLVCIAAGAFGVPVLPFVAALAAGRGGRFLGLAVLVRAAGPAVAERLGLPWGGTPRGDAAAGPGGGAAR